MPRKYDIQLHAVISIGGEFEANSAAEAIETATRQLKAQGEISNVEVERAIYIDDEEPAMPEPPDWPENVIHPIDLL